MNREIKFRGKRVSNGEWVFGVPVVRFDGLVSMVDYCGGNPVHAETVGQYTGLKDKNGVKIFEDDIVRSLSEGYGDVYFDEGQFWINWNEGLQPLVDCYRELTVIGTIHDNPELLEV